MKQEQINKIFARALYKLSEYLSNNGCNDLDNFFIKDISKKDIINFYSKELDNDDIKKIDDIQDWLFFRLLAHKIHPQVKDEIKTVGRLERKQNFESMTSSEETKLSNEDYCDKLF